jgi:predicted permease
MNTLRQDIRFALRAVRRDPAFFAAAIAIIALGIGANTAMFSVVHGILFRPVEFKAADRLVWIENSGGSDGGLSSRTTRVFNYMEWKKMNQSFEDMTAYFAFFDYGSYTLTGKGEPERLVGVGVEQNFLPFLGVQPMLGRNFVAEETRDDSPPAVLLTHGLWQRRFGSDPGIVGRALTLNDKPATVIGVLPATFDFQTVFTPGQRVDMILPFPFSGETDNWGNTLAILGRLKPGVTMARAQAEFTGLSNQLSEARKDRGNFGARMAVFHDYLTARFRHGLIVLLAAVGLVLLIACTNLSNLLLARATSRRKEVAIRAALGASRMRLVQQMLTESLMVSLVGAVVGLGVAYAAVWALAHTQDISIPLLATVRVDPVVLLFTVLLALGTGAFMGTVPALQASSTKAAEAMNDAGRGTSEGRRGGWLRSSLVVTQVALACLLLVGAGLLIRSFARVLDVDLGFRPEHAASWRVETGDRYKKDVERRAFFDRIVRRVQSIPGVESVGVTDALPLSRDRSWGIGVRGVKYPPGQYPIAHPRVVDWRYLQTMKIRLVAGRLIGERDTSDREGVVVINEKAAKRLWPGENAVGKMVRFGGDRRVVGVVANVRHQAIEEEGGLEAYIPVMQDNSVSMELVVRTRLEVSSIAPSIRAALREVDPALVGGEYQRLDALVERAVSPRRFLMMLLAGFAGAALLLASVGIYAVVSYSVGQRKQEIGIRMALGAPAASVRRMVMAKTAAMAGIGIVIGAVSALFLGRLTSSLLYGVEAVDPVSFGGTISVLVLVALLAGFWPARRASRVNPLTALRGD